MSRWKPETLEERFWGKVDKSGDCWEWTASRRANGYGQIMIDKVNRTAHRVAYELANGPIAACVDIDHTCRNRACVRPDHLREASRKQNMENLGTARAASGIRGVSWDKARGKWSAKLGHNGKSINLGRFDSSEEAGKAVKAKRLELFTHNELDKKADA